jgi:hypothetical protein
MLGNEYTPNARNNRSVTNLINALPGNGFVNTAQHATVDKAMFYMMSAPRPVLVTDQ